MRKLYILGAVVLAASALAAVSAASASAIGWLLNGVAVASETAATVEGLLLLTDLKAPGGAATVACEGILDGFVSTGGLELVTALLTLAGVEVKLAGTALSCKVEAGACEKTVSAEVWVEGLPWEATLAVAEPTESSLMIDQTKGEQAFSIKCLVLGIAFEDECKGQGDPELQNAEKGVLAKFTYVEAEGDVGNCSMGGENSFEVTGEATIAVAGHTLSAG